MGLATLFAASSCATNTIRIDRAETMTAAGRAATDATRAAMTAVQAENREALIDLLAVDPNCRFPEPAFVPESESARGVLFCRRGGPGPRDTKIARLTHGDFAPTLAVIDGLVAYLDAVDAVATRKPVDLGAGFADAVGTLNGIASDLATIAGQDAPKSPLTSDQIDAVSSVLTLLGEIAQEAQQVHDLRQIELTGDPMAFSVSIASLKNANAHWLGGADAAGRTVNGRLDTEFDRRGLAAQLQLTRTPARAYERRRELVAQRMSLLERTEALPALRVQLAKTVDALETAHRDYIALLFGDSRQLTLKEKRKAAQITRTRLRAALSALASVVKAF